MWDVSEDTGSDPDGGGGEGVSNELKIDLVTGSRRGFLMEVFSAGALILGGTFVLGEDPAYGAAPLTGDASKAAFNPNIFLGIEPDGTVIVVAHRSEMGTGSRTSLPMILADELEADWKRVRVQQAIGDKRYGDQNTDGSCSVRDFYVGMRQTGAGARMMLERAAASKWGVDPSECKAKVHQVVHLKSGKTLGYGELASLAALQPVPKAEEIKLKTAAEFRYIGKENSVPIADLENLCTGRGVFGMDVHLPGMLYASIERSPVYGGKLKSFDDTAAKAVKGVQSTMVIDGFKPPHMF